MSKETPQEERHALRQQINGAAALMVLTVCFVALHFLAILLRKTQRAVFGWDNSLILASLCLYVPMCALIIANATANMAFNAANTKASGEADYVLIYKTSYAIGVLYPLVSTLPKLSLCMLYLRVFGVKLWARRISYSMLALLTVNAIAWLVPKVLICIPPSDSWSLQGVRGKRCINNNVFGTWINVPNIVADLVLLVVPIPIMWRTQMSVPQRLGLIATFATGSIGIVGACLRLGVYVRRTYVDRPGTKQTTKSIALDLIVTNLECGMYLIAACMPSLRILLVQLHKLVTRFVASLVQRDRGLPPDRSSGLEAAEDWSGKMPANRVFVKLTGLGLLNTLVSKGRKLGLNRTSSGIWETHQPSLLAHKETDGSELVDAETWTPVCPLCKCVRPSENKPLPELPSRLHISRSLQGRPLDRPTIE